MTNEYDSNNIDFSEMFEETDEYFEKQKSLMYQTLEMVNALLDGYKFGEDEHTREFYAEDDEDELRLYIQTYNKFEELESSRMVAKFESYDEAYLFLRGYFEALFVPVNEKENGIVD